MALTSPILEFNGGKLSEDGSIVTDDGIPFYEISLFWRFFDVGDTLYDDGEADMSDEGSSNTVQAFYLEVL